MTPSDINPRVVLVGTAGTKVQMLRSLAMSQLTNDRMRINRIGAVDSPTRWACCMRDWHEDRQRQVDWPPADPIECFDGIDIDVRQMLSSTVERWYQIALPEFCRDAVLDEIMLKGAFPTRSEYESNPSAYEYDHVGRMYIKMARKNIDDPRLQMQDVMRLACIEVEAVRDLPNTQIIDLFDLLDADRCAGWVSNIIGCDLPHPGLLHNQHRVWRYYNRRFMEDMAGLARSNGRHLNISVPDNIDGILGYELCDNLYKR